MEEAARMPLPEARRAAAVTAAAGGEERRIMCGLTFWEALVYRVCANLLPTVVPTGVPVTTMARAPMGSRAAAAALSKICLCPGVG